MAKTGMLRKRTFPGRIRASGFLESDVAELLTGGVTTATDVTEGMA
jgi:hypothetical protein